MRARLLFTGVALGAILLGGATAAQAAGGTAPACVSRYVRDSVEGFDVAITNNCTKTMRVQVVVSGDSDSPCYTLSPGEFEAFQYTGIFGKYERLAVC
ncbi:beta-Ig-H3/fasciclin [Streptomyces sp. YIM B13518]|uniref:beta-Ig-H3/fasciclin n=1 Tax=Streptomyces sp. YIM B13518 TaxID=3366316 RepID=UPI0036B076EB